MSIKSQRILTVTMFLLACAIFTWRFWPQTQASPHCAMHEAKVAQGQGQDGQEPGNPDHIIPAKHCATNPKADQVGCKCAKHRTCNSDGTANEAISCKSFCWKNFCLCASPPCP